MSDIDIDKIKEHLKKPSLGSLSTDEIDAGKGKFFTNIEDKVGLVSGEEINPKDIEAMSLTVDSMKTKKALFKDERNLQFILSIVKYLEENGDANWSTMSIGGITPSGFGNMLGGLCITFEEFHKKNIEGFEYLGDVIEELRSLGRYIDFFNIFTNNPLAKFVSHVGDRNLKEMVTYEKFKQKMKEIDDEENKMGQS